MRAVHRPVWLRPVNFRSHGVRLVDEAFDALHQLVMLLHPMAGRCVFKQCF